MQTLGVDVAKATLEVAMWPAAGGRSGVAVGTFANEETGWEALAARVAAHRAADEGAADEGAADEGAADEGAADEGAVTLVLEPTGGYELGLACWAHQRGWQVLRPNPRQVREWARSQGQRAKTDRQDALLLAHYGVQVPTPPWQPLPLAIGELEALLRRRDELDGLLAQERRRQEQVAARPGVPAVVPQSLARVIRALEEERVAVEEAITTHLRQHPTLAQTRERLLTVPGLGPKNVLPVLVLLARWHTLTDGRGQAQGLVAYAGLDPQPRESGLSLHRPARISRLGDRRLRSRLYMGALGAIRGHNPLRAFYDRLVGRGKAKKLALVAAARKLLVWAWAVFHSGTPFDAAKTIQLAA